MPDDAALIAHLLRRVSFGPLPGQVEALEPHGYDAAVETVLSAPPLPAFPPPAAGDDLATAWLRWMRRPDAGLHEKLTWFWHGHFTSSVDAVDPPSLLYRQHLVLRRHALGDFRQLVRDITTDAAMLQYLNGDGSTGDAPNENYARELMELFTLGRGNYTQSDVRAAARALSGWSVSTSGAVSFDPEKSYSGELTFLGVTGTLRVDDVCRIVCNHHACAPFVVGELYRFLVGVEASPSRRASLAATFLGGGMQIAPLVAEILRSQDFRDSVHARPRFPVEWATAAQAALGQDTTGDLAPALGQTPFAPPNVAGWPPGDRWLSGGASLARAQAAIAAEPVPAIVNAADPVAAALRHCGLVSVSPETEAAIRRATAWFGDDRAAVARIALGLALLSPEFALA
jgi:uncharacterized protein (DUF1800 family)